VRRGRALVTTHVTVTQNDETLLVARCHHSSPWDGDVYSDVASPLARPDDAVRLDTGAGGHLNNVETWLHPSTVPFGGGARAEWIAMFGDYFPPAVFARRTQPSRAVSIEYSIQIHKANKEWTLADDEYLAARVHAFTRTMASRSRTA
jgi:hypothetical protein